MDMNNFIQGAFPLVAASLGGSTPWASGSGMRFIVASNGLFREITLPWIRFRHNIAPSQIKTPYGELENEARFLCGQLPARCANDFMEHARSGMPNEVAGAIVWNSKTYHWRYAKREAISASAAHINYREVVLGEDEHIVIDLHSHGQLPAFFSEEDDKDDAGAMRLSVVVGSLSSPKGESVARLCMAGKTFKVEINQFGDMEVKF